MTIFKKIIDGELEADIVYRDDHCVAFKDINPQAPVHILIVPRQEIRSLADASPDDHAVLGHILLKTAEIARRMNLESEGYRVVTNTGPAAGQSVEHLHFHLLGGRNLSWPPG